MRETPQSVSIITRELLDDLGAVRLDQALEPGRFPARDRWCAQAPGWEASGSYTFLKAEEADGKRAVPNQSRHLLRLSTAYRFEGRWQGLKVGGSATYSETWYGRPPARDTRARIPQAGYALYKLMASYVVTPKTTLQQNVNNLLDKKYYRNVGFYDSVFWSEPRNVNVSLRTRF